MIEFRLFGIDIKIKFLFVALVTVFLIVDKSSISIIALMVCIIHETGHLIIFTIFGYKPSELAFEVTGIRLSKPTTSLSYAKEILAQLAGSITNFIVFFALIGTTNSISKMSLFCVTNLIVGIFNLLPLKSFDGGKLLEIFSLKIFSLRTTAIICTIADYMCLFIMLVGSIIAFFSKGQSFTLLVLSAYLLIATIAKLDFHLK